MQYMSFQTIDYYLPYISLFTYIICDWSRPSLPIFCIFLFVSLISNEQPRRRSIYVIINIMHMPYNILILLNLKLFYKAWSMCLKSIKHVQPCCLSDFQTQADVQWLYRSILDMIYGRECCCREKFTQIGRMLYLWIQQLIIKHCMI
jgi:hypothetical protein